MAKWLRWCAGALETATVFLVAFGQASAADLAASAKISMSVLDDHKRVIEVSGLSRDELAALVLSGPVLGSWGPIEALLGVAEIPDTPIDPATLSRDLSVGEAYATDPLVWHGPFKRETVEAFDRCLTTIAAGGRLGALPTLWVHGEADELVPLEGTRGGIERIRGEDLTEVLYPGARHEVFNETNKDEVLGDVTTFATRHLG